jgi:hypothetical protein
MKHEQLMAQDSTIECLLLGDSRMEQGIEAARLPNTYNMAHPSQLLAYDSLLLGYYLPRLPRLKTVVIDLSASRLVEGLRAAGTRTHLYKALYVPPASVSDWLRAQMISLQFSPREALKVAFSNLEPLNPADQGSRFFGSCLTPTKAQAQARLAELAAYAEPNTEEANWRRLQSMQAYCKEHGVALLIWFPPSSTAMRQLEDSPTKQVVAKCLELGIDVADFSCLVPDSLFSDADHVCLKGAAISTDSLAKVL